MCVHPCGHSHGINKLLCFIKFCRLTTYLQTKKQRMSTSLDICGTQSLGMGLGYSMIAMCLLITLKKPFLVFFIWLKISLTPLLSTSCSFHFPSRFLMPFAGFSIEAGVNNAMTMWVKVQRMMNSVSQSFLKLFSWY